jgi:hypothetical protein
MSIRGTPSVKNPFLIAIVGLVAATLFSVVNRQFDNYAKGRPSYFKSVEGRPIIASAMVLIGAIVGGALITTILGKSFLFFGYLTAAFVLCGVAFAIIFVVLGKR